MKAITIRGIEPEVAEKLKQTANSQGKSTNRFILDMVKKELGFEKKKQYSRRYNDLDDLFGTWSENEFQEISKDESIRSSGHEKSNDRYEHILHGHERGPGHR